MYTIHIVYSPLNMRKGLTTFAYTICLQQLPITGWRRRPGCLIFVGHSPQKSPIISGCFAKNDILWVFATLYNIAVDSLH